MYLGGWGKEELIYIFIVSSSVSTSLTLIFPSNKLMILIIPVSWKPL